MSTDRTSRKKSRNPLLMSEISIIDMVSRKKISEDVE